MMEYIRFLLAGGTAAVANYLSRFIFSTWLDYEVAIVLAYSVGMAVAFSLMRNYVFSAGNGRLLHQVGKFVVINLLALMQTLLVSMILAAWLYPQWMDKKLAEAVAHFVGVLVPAVTSYVGHKHLTFRTWRSSK